MGYDIDEVRRRAMALLELEAGGSATAAAKRAGMTYTQWANLRSGAHDSKTGKPRGMRKETARRIEKAFGKPEGWLDSADLVEPGFPEDEDLNTVLRAWGLAEPHEKAVVMAWAQATLATRKVS